MNSFQKTKQRGLSLIEAAMVLALSAVVVSGVMYYMSTANENLQNRRVTEMFISITQHINALYSNQSKSAYTELTRDSGYQVLKKFFPGGEVKSITNRLGSTSTGVTLNGIPGVFSLYGTKCSDTISGFSTCAAVQYWIPKSYSENDAYNQCVAVISKNFGDSILAKQANGSGESVAGSNTDIQKISTICKNPSGITLFIR
ncbi:type II secretion system protein [Escherichia coli]|uniref:type II secretion system protein n=1 Tax=Escherichia coli TaxID=562 RepID=UPI003078BC41